MASGCLGSRVFGIWYHRNLKSPFSMPQKSFALRMLHCCGVPTCLPGFRCLALPVNLGVGVPSLILSGRTRTHGDLRSGTSCRSGMLQPGRTVENKEWNAWRNLLEDHISTVGNTYFYPLRRGFLRRTLYARAAQGLCREVRRVERRTG
jgi:hypothetical protein